MIKQEFKKKEKEKIRKILINLKLGLNTKQEALSILEFNEFDDKDYIENIFKEESKKEINNNKDAISEIILGDLLNNEEKTKKGMSLENVFNGKIINDGILKIVKQGEIESLLSDFTFFDFNEDKLKEKLFLSTTVLSPILEIFKKFEDNDINKLVEELEKNPIYSEDLISSY